MNKIATKSEIKFVKSLKLKKNRVKENKFIVEGLKNVQELLKSKYDVLELFAQKHMQIYLIIMVVSLFLQKNYRIWEPLTPTMLAWQ